VLGMLVLLLLGAVLFAYVSGRRVRLTQLPSAPVPASVVPAAAVSSPGLAEAEVDTRRTVTDRVRD
jgi:hypothetical protein